MNVSTGWLPAGYGMRAPREEDAEAVVTLLRACDVAIFGEPDTDIKDVRDEWSTPGFDLGRDAWLIQGVDGAAAGLGWIRRRAEWDFDGDLRVLPGESVDSLAPLILEAIEGRARELATGAPQGVALCFFAASVETELRSMLERSGYDKARTYFRMRIDLPVPVGSDVFPFGDDRKRSYLSGETSLPPPGTG